MALNLTKIVLAMFHLRHNNRAQLMDFHIHYKDVLLASAKYTNLKKIPEKKVVSHDQLHTNMFVIIN